MDADIQTTTPNGSPILAYGEARGPRLSGRVVILALCVLAILSFVGLGAYILFTPIELPQNTFVLASFHAGEHLSDPLPRLWQNTAQTSKLPFVAGLAKTANGVRPFTITFRGFGNAGSWTHGTGPFVIHADQDLQLEKIFRVFTIARLIYALGHHSAFVTVNGSVLDQTLGGSLSGWVDGATWKTTTKIDRHSSAELTDGDVAVDLVALPDSWPLLHDALKDMGVDLSQTPETVAWTQASGTLPSLTLHYGDGSPSSSTILALAAATGQFDSDRIQLPDGTIVDDLRLPTHLLDATSSVSWQAASDTTIRIDTHTISIEDGKPPVSEPVVCPGHAIARLGSGALSSLALRVQFPLEGITSVGLSDDNGTLLVCWQ